MIRRILSRLFRPSKSFSGWKGNYDTWHEAQSLCSGYDDSLILDKVSNSIQKVKKFLIPFKK